MSNFRSPRRRRAWFDRGAAALANAVSGVRDLYRCPVCLHDFDDPDQLTFEHVPPRNDGGREMVLTCRPCNSWSGHTLDCHVAGARAVREFASGTRRFEGSMEIQGRKVNVDFGWEPNVTSVNVHDRNHPDAPGELQQIMQTIVPDTPESEIQIEIPLPPSNETRVRVSFLRAGYLAAFAALGYRYILDPALDLVRRQIGQPDTDLVGLGSGHVDVASSEPRIVAVSYPQEARGLIVQMGNRVICLPPTRSRDFYPRVNEYVRASGMRPTFRGTLIPWPREPVFSMDLGTAAP